jgi:hypothetical protein
MSLNHRLMLLLSSLLFCHFKSFDFAQRFAKGLTIIFESIKQASEFYNNIGSSNIIKSIKNDKPIGRKKLNRLLTFCYI